MRGILGPYSWSVGAPSSVVVVDRFLDIIIICEAAVLPLALCLGLLLMLTIVTLSQLARHVLFRSHVLKNWGQALGQGVAQYSCQTTSQLSCALNRIASIIQ